MERATSSRTVKYTSVCQHYAPVGNSAKEIDDIADDLVKRNAA